MAAPVNTSGEFTAGKPEILFKLPGAAENRGFYRAPYTASPDGKRFLLAVPGKAARQRLIVILNWMRLLD